jgi:tRNA-Thr(GGU) m(6)t(6)A37 methyltransferase TsaA
VPRQGNLLSKTKARIVLCKDMDIASLEGLEHFDYLWIVYVFHLNQGFLKPKIQPPKYEGPKLGIFATRTPHRYNPIGLTLVKLDKVVKGEVYISSVDMISGTPILDIKPYHHLESLELDKIKYPQWIMTQASEEKKAKVIFKENAIEDLKYILLNYKLEFYDNLDEFVELITGVLECDPHSKHTQKKKETVLYGFYVDKLNVIYEYSATDKLVTIHTIEYYKEYKKLRNKSWLESYNNEYMKNP